MPLPDKVDMTEKPEVFWSSDCVSAMRTPSKSREGKYHLTLITDTVEGLEVYCSCEGFQYQDHCVHTEELLIITKERYDG